MARIRSIKPDFWTSEQVMECSPNARLMFIGMWNFADDTGRLPHSAKAIKAKIFPSDDISLDSIRGMLRELSTNGLILVYAVENEEFLQITGWQHQRIDKPQPSKYPAPFFDDSGKVLGMLPPDRKGEDKKGKEKISRSAAPSNEDFENLKKVYPRRNGNYGWKAAERKFNSLVKTGVDPKTVIAAAVRLCETLKSKIGTEYIPMPASWLNSEDFVECAVLSFEQKDDGLIEVLDQLQLESWDSYARSQGRPTYPRNKKGGWRFPSKWPPGHETKMLEGVQRLVAGQTQ